MKWEIKTKHNLNTQHNMKKDDILLKLMYIQDIVVDRF